MIASTMLALIKVLHCSSRLKPWSSSASPGSTSFQCFTIVFFKYRAAAHKNMSKGPTQGSIYGRWEELRASLMRGVAGAPPPPPPKKNPV